MSFLNLEPTPPDTSKLALKNASPKNCASPLTVSSLPGLVVPIPTLPPVPFAKSMSPSDRIWRSAPPVPSYVK